MTSHVILYYVHIQMLDELPMIYSALIMAYILLEHKHIRPKFKRSLIILLSIHAALTTVLVASPAIAPQYSSPTLQFICFHLSFGFLELFLFYKQTRIWLSESDPKARRLHILGLCFWCISLCLWLLDHLGCSALWEGNESFRKSYMYTILSGEHYHFPNPQYDHIKIVVIDSYYIIDFMPGGIWGRR